MGCIGGSVLAEGPLHEEAQVGDNARKSVSVRSGESGRACRQEMMLAACSLSREQRGVLEGFSRD